jgi:hypothetical protein
MAAEPELGRVGLADEDGAGVAQAPGQSRVGRRHVLGVERGAVGGGDPLRRDEILDRKRQAPEGATAGPAVADVGLGHQRAAIAQRHDGVQRRISRVDPVEEGRHDLGRGDLAAAKAPREVDGRQRGQAHGASTRGWRAIQSSTRTR